MDLVDKIKETAKHQGFTLAQISEKANLGEKTIYQWKKHSPKIETLQRVADVLNVSVDYLQGKTDNPYIKSADETNELTEAVTEVVTDAINNAQAYNGKAPTESDKKLMTDLLTAWLKSGGK